MKISIVKAPPYFTNHTVTAIWCDNPDCRGVPEYFNERQSVQIGRTSIKEGTIVAQFNMNTGDCGKGNGVPARIFHFCFDCIDLIYRDVKGAMDKSLWVFH